MQVKHKQVIALLFFFIAAFVMFAIRVGGMNNDSRSKCLCTA